MRREISCRLDGRTVVQTTTVLDDKGGLHSENVSALGDRDTVLAHLEEQVAEAARDRDGISSPARSKPPPPGDGAPGEEVSFWLSGTTVCRTETRRGADGKLQNQRSSPLGPWRDRMANAEERLAELTELRDKVAAAK